MAQKIGTDSSEVDLEALKIGLDFCKELLGDFSKIKVKDDKLSFSKVEFKIETSDDIVRKVVHDLLKRFVTESNQINEIIERASQAISKLRPGLPQQREPKSKDDSSTRNSKSGQARKRHTIHETRVPFPSKDFSSLMNNRGGMKTALGIETSQQKALSISQVDRTIKISSLTNNVQEKIKELQKENEDLRRQKEANTRDILLRELMSSLSPGSKDDKDKMMRKLIERNADLTDRLASEMNARIALNESKLENVHIQNRPLRIADEYRHVMSDEWLDAKEVLDERSPDSKYEKVKNLFLSGTLEISVKEASEHYSRLLEKFSAMLNDPIHIKEVAKKTHSLKGAEKLDSRTGTVEATEENISLPPYLLTNISDYLRERADLTDLSTLIEHITREVLRAYAENTTETELMMKTEAFQSYLKRCARLGWKMVLQRPPMYLDTSDIAKKWDPTKLDLALEAKPNKAGARVAYYKYPSLFHGSKCLVKGVAVVE